MSTFEVGLKTKLINSLTTIGRKKNSFYKEMNKRGVEYILQRDLKDGSSVILAYEGIKTKYADYAIKFNKDGSCIFKKELVYNIPCPREGVKSRGTSIEKIWFDEFGDVVKNETFDSKRLNHKVYDMNRVEWVDNICTRVENYRKTSELK